MRYFLKTLIFTLSIVLIGCGEEDPKKLHYFLIETPKGNMIGYLSNKTPLHRDNFKNLAHKGFYDGLLFHRVINGFMIQGGDPDSKMAEEGDILGNGSPGYTIPAEFDSSLIHKRGALAAARMGDNVNPNKESSGSQFYIVQGKKYSPSYLNRLSMQSGNNWTSEQIDFYSNEGGTPQLDGQYTVFGQIIQGLEVLDSIALLPRDRMDRPYDDIWMKVKMIKKPN